jgi:hypothetical protein
MLNRGNLCLGKYYDPNIHGAMGLSLCGLRRNEQDYTNWSLSSSTQSEPVARCALIKEGPDLRTTPRPGNVSAPSSDSRMLEMFTP